MQSTLIKSRNKSYKQQQGRCIYCELPMWNDNPENFAMNHGITIKQAMLFKCTAEHLIAKQDGGKNHVQNIVAACKFCNQKRHARKEPKDPLTYKNHVIKRQQHNRWNTSNIPKRYVSSQM